MTEPSENYCFEISKKGQQSLDILDRCFNASTQKFLIKNGLTKNQHILDIGCGTGTMSRWIAEQVGENGTVLAIDNSENQINSALEIAKSHASSNINFKVLSAYDIEKLDNKFDMIYCRFILHHLMAPDQIIQKAYQLLKPNGIFVCEEGIVSHGFSYPPSEAFKTILETDEIPDKNIGKKLFYKFSAAKFTVMDYEIYQPVLISSEDKSLLLAGLNDSKKFMLQNGTTESEWQNIYDETLKLIQEKNQIIGFYASAKIAGKK